jgi:hypothetical protein
MIPPHPGTDHKDLPMARTSVFLAAALAFPPSILAQAGDATTHACARVVEPVDRLACYDAAFGAPVPDPVVVERRAVEEFGLSDSEKRERDPMKATAAVDPKRIEAKVTKLAYGANGERIVSLDNGQVWVTTETSMRGNVKVGDAVAVRKAALGTHMLVTAARVPLRVKRVR